MGAFGGGGGPFALFGMNKNLGMQEDPGGGFVGPGGPPPPGVGESSGGAPQNGNGSYVPFSIPENAPDWTPINAPDMSDTSGDVGGGAIITPPNGNRFPQHGGGPFPIGGGGGAASGGGIGGIVAGASAGFLFGGPIGALVGAGLAALLGKKK